MPDLDPFAGLAAVLAAAPVQVDPHRQSRKGVPEVVYAAGKSPRLTLLSVRDLLAEQPAGRVLVSRAAPEVADLLRDELEPQGVTLQATPGGGTLLVTRADAHQPAETGGVVAVLTAGASDAPAADEAAWVAREMGCRIVRADDVGVAGLHRLEEPLRSLREQRADVAIVVAGMDGALPSVVSGLVDLPVIGLPTSVGYGLGGGGVAALLSMLQTCAPGLVVVNIDNGVGAGATAALIANRAAAARASTS
ncbi:MAG TPA: nickel pincer cofactor biosynthesis protein LarB [Chloroflexota bacterium]